MSRILPVLVVTVAVACAVQACRSGERATQEQCAEILDRMVQLDMEALGFHDPALTELKQRDLRAKFSGALQECTQLTLNPGALECVRRATTTKEVVEGCLHE